MAKTKAKKYLVIPRDAYALLDRFHSTEDEAIDAAEDAVTMEGQAMYVLQLKAVSSRKDPPVQTRKIR